MIARNGLLLLALGAGALIPLSAASGRPEASRGDAAARSEDPEEAILEILDDYQEAMAAFREATSKAASDEERRKLFEEEYPDAGEYARRLWKVVDAQPAHPACGEALAWIYQNAGDERAAELLLEHHIASEHVGAVCFAYVRRTSGARPTLERVLEAATTPEVKGLAMLCLGQHLMALADEAEKAQALDEEQRTLLAERAGDAALIEWMDCDPALVREEGQALLEKVEAGYADVPHPHGGTLGEVAGGQLFELRHLQLGMIAPDIEGSDLSGVSFKLSDYRGKVVVLDFWGNW